MCYEVQVGSLTKLRRATRMSMIVDIIDIASKRLRSHHPILTNNTSHIESWLVEYLLKAPIKYSKTRDSSAPLDVEVRHRAKDRLNASSLLHRCSDSVTALGLCTPTFVL